jgi:hypothetical protein
MSFGRASVQSSVIGGGLQIRHEHFVIYQLFQISEDKMNLTILIVGGIAILVVIVLLIPVFRKSNKVDLLPLTNEKPEYMRDMPPAETVAATLEDGEGITVFDFDEGEKLTAPFAEQIEDILRAKLKADPALSKYEIDLGTGENNLLEIWVNDVKYLGISELPDERLKQAFRDSVKQWNTK